jgi:hypothetical protein
MFNLLGNEAGKFVCANESCPLTSHVVSLAEKIVVESPEPAVQKGEGGFADWLIKSMHSLRECLNQPYRRLLDILHEIPNIVDILGLDRRELLDFITLCKRKQ